MKFVKKHKDSKEKKTHPTTVMVNNVQREKSREAVRQALTWLSKTFPKAFNVEGAIRPLKIGIYKDILAYAEQNGGLPFSKAKLHKVLVVFTRRMEYLTCIKMRDTRIDLNGEEVEAVSEEAAKSAVLRIKKTIEKTMRPPRKSSGPRGGDRGHRAGGHGAPKRRYPSSNQGGYNPYRDNAPREQGHYRQDSDEQSPATVRVKRRYPSSPRRYENNPYSGHHSGSTGNAGNTHQEPRSHHQQPEKNYNSETYNTNNSPLSTVARLKEKLGIRRKESFDNED